MSGVLHGMLASLNDTDPHGSSVVALLRGNGSNDSTTITDNSPLASNWTAAGNAKISTSVKKFGTGSISMLGSSYIEATATSSNFAFGTSAFTIEFWLYLFSSSGAQILYDGRPAGTQTTQPTLYHSNGQLYYYTNSSNVITGGTLNTSTWYHIALCRSGSSTKMFIDGVQTGSTYTDNVNYTNSSNRPIFGADGFGGGNNMNGYVDDLRVTKGVARYTGTFTPPGEL